MAHSSSAPAGGRPDTMDVMEHRRGWQGFLKFFKWSALLTFGLTFFLIIWLIGHAPLVPTFVIVALLVFGAGALFH